MNLNFKIGALVIMLMGATLSINALSLNPDTLMANPSQMKLATPDSILLNSNDFGNMMVPWHGKVISKFGPRHSRMHTGTDVKLLKGDTVRCAFDGIVDIDKAHYGYGLLVSVGHAHRVTTYYGHLSKILVKKGQALKAGDVVGLGGQTGRATTTHLHFELRVDGKPLNSQQIFDFENNKFVCLTIKPSPAKSLATTQSNKVKTSATANTSSLVTASDNGESTLTHIITKGDTLYNLAKAYSTTVLSICSLNGISARSTLKIGNILKVR